MAFYHSLYGKDGVTPTPSVTYGEVQVLLWENPSPSSTFSAQTITLNLSDYDGVIIDVYGYTTQQYVQSRVKYFKNDSYNNDLGCGYKGDSTSASRQIVMVDDNGVTFGNGYSGSSIDNSECIPFKIYGYRKYNDTDVTGIISNVMFISGSSTGTVPSGYKKSYFIPYRVGGKYSATINGTEVMADNDNTTFQVFEVQPNDTFSTSGSTGTRNSILIQLN